MKQFQKWSYYSFLYTFYQEEDFIILFSSTFEMKFLVPAAGDSLKFQH